MSHLLLTSDRCDEPFKSCRMRLGSVDRSFDHDEEDMTWVEYQWLARTNHESPRMVRVEWYRPLRQCVFVGSVVDYSSLHLAKVRAV